MAELPQPLLPKPLVDVSWLADHLGDEQLVILDASVPPVVPGFNSLNANGEFSAIPGARRFDYDNDICDPNTSLPHMMPSAELFQARVRELGIDPDSRIVIYDDVGIYASPRAWWMFRAMGHDEVAVLDGGLPAWLEAGQAVVSTCAKIDKPGRFVAAPASDGFCDFNAVLAAIDDNACVILDARSSGRFHGTEPEPRPNVRPGHMPSAKNLPFPEVLDGLFMKPQAELERFFAPLSGPEQTVITTCGSGLTACILTLAAYQAGYRNLQVYDGSWAEWGRPSKLPVVTADSRVNGR